MNNRETVPEFLEFIFYWWKWWGRQRIGKEIRYFQMVTTAMQILRDNVKEIIWVCFEDCGGDGA